MRLLRHCGGHHNQRTLDKAKLYALDEAVRKEVKYKSKSLKAMIKETCGEVL